MHHFIIVLNQVANSCVWQYIGLQTYYFWS